MTPDDVVEDCQFCAIARGKDRSVEVVCEDKRWWFCSRTNRGTETMSYAELRAAFLATREKLAKLGLMISEVEHLQNGAQEVNARAASYKQSGWRGGAPSAYDYSMLAALVPDVVDLLANDLRSSACCPSCVVPFSVRRRLGPQVRGRSSPR